MRVLFGLLAASVLMLGCAGDEAEEAETEGPVRRTTRIDPNDMGDLDAVSLRLEDLVAVGDVAGIEAMWLQPEQVRGCNAGGEELPNAALEQFLASNREAFVTRAEKTLGHGWSGSLVFTFDWEGPRELMGKRLRGQACPATAFGRVWVYVRGSSGPRAVEHRFNLLRVDGEWRVFRYRGIRARCRDERWADGPMCARLANARPKIRSKTRPKSK